MTTILRISLTETSRRTDIKLSRDILCRSECVIFILYATRLYHANNKINGDSESDFRKIRDRHAYRNGRRLILVDCTLPTLKVFRIGANACRSFAYSRMLEQVSTHCSGTSGSPTFGDPIFRISPIGRHSSFI